MDNLIQTHVYTIDENQMESLKRRLLIRNFMITGCILLFIDVAGYSWMSKSDLISYVFVIAFSALIILKATYSGTNKLIKSYKTFQLVLNKDGVEAKAEMMPYKKINWNNLLIGEKSNGAINLYDKSISVFMRKMYGKGWIVVQPETMNKQVLLNEIIKYQQPY